MLIAPALTGSRLKQASGDVDDGIHAAEERLRESIASLREGNGLRIREHIGDADPLLAIEDGLREFPADEVLIITRPDGDARFMEADIFDRARRRLEQPITHISLATHGAGGEITAVESADGHDAEPAEAERKGYSQNFPPMSWHDIAGIVVAIVGTIVLIVLAANCGGDAVGGATSDVGGDSNGCVIRYILAGAAALANIAHVVGLFLFESVRYRGPWQRFLAMLSLVGTPLALMASLLVE